MNEVFKTVVVLSIIGFTVALPLILLKPVTLKKFPAMWQYIIWLFVILIMVFPVYKFIPKKEAKRLNIIPRTDFVIYENLIEPSFEEEKTIIQKNEEIATPKKEIDYFKLAIYIWIIGFILYLLIVFSSYILYIYQKRKNSVIIKDNAVFSEVKSRLNIRRNIKLKVSGDVNSPLLVGVFFPVVYLPTKNIDEKNLRMVFLHELTHYKNRDLLVKWFSIFVNAVHWFNPASYFITYNLSEACELKCDMEVTKNMSVDEMKNYMKTILELGG